MIALIHFSCRACLQPGHGGHGAQVLDVVDMNWYRAVLQVGSKCPGTARLAFPSIVIKTPREVRLNEAFN